MRTIGSVTDAILSAPNVEYWHFLKIVFPTVTILLTNRPYGATENVDGSIKSWIEGDFTFGPIKQSRTDVMVVNWISLANLNYNWTNYAYNPGVRNVPVYLYEGWWNVDTGAFIAAYPIFEGRLDEGDFSDRAKITMKPHHTPWDSVIPQSKMDGKCTNDYRNPMDCQYAGAEPVGQLTCDKTRKACRDRGNEINSNIYDRLPEEGTEIMYGGIRHGLSPNPANLKGIGR